MVAPKYRTRLIDAYADELLKQLPALLVLGPRAAGKSRTFSRRATTTVRLDREAEAGAFQADPDAALGLLDEPALLDEWQAVPGVFGAVRRAVEADPSPSRFFVAGSVRAALENDVWPGTGRLIRLTMYPMSVREQLGHISGPTFFDKLVNGEALAAPTDSPDITGYLELALQGGFPTPALTLSGVARQAWLESYLDDMLTYDIEQVESPERSVDVNKLRAYFEAYAVNSAGVLDHKRIFDAAHVSKHTADAYEHLLTRLFAIEQLPAWATNRLKRLIRGPKRYVIDPALIGAALRLDVPTLMRDSDQRGRILETFVLAQLRPEVATSTSRPRLYHLRTEEGRREVDILAELSGGQVIGIEVKAGAAPDEGEAKHLKWLREELGDKFAGGVLFHTGPRIFELDERIVAAPISALWG